MNLKSSLGAFALCAAFGLSACSTSSSTSASPENSSSSTQTSSAGGGGASTSGILPATANPTYTAALYDTWKAFHYITLEDEATRYPTWGAEFSTVFGAYTAQGLGAARVIWSTFNSASCTIAEASGSNMYKRGCTVSEGIGYGMLITLFQGDWDAFNRLWIYSQAYRNSAYASGRGLMPWLTSSFSWDIPDESSATDADLDIATSLILAYYMSGNTAYLNDALTLIAALWDNEVNLSNHLLYSGDTPTWKAAANPSYNLSYFSPVALRLFALVDKNHDWTSVLNAQYTYMLNVQAAGTGVFPDWSDGSGNAINPPNNSAKTTYWTFNKESVRIPWRIAWDYYWFADERAASVLNTLNNFIMARSNNDPLSIPAVNYSWNLSIGADIQGQNLPTQWQAAWCATGMAGNSMDWLNTCTNVLNATVMQTSASSYFPNILQMMYSQLLNGMYVKPSNMGI
ncbi:glycosyl hydrolase family 8 [Hallerella succinigenes]|uniref:cellulase n=1 Tax=Hallerella succinigenes TaxID=1896222 RepID=A0A2M9A5E2_9BACT|nr:glycosyl hydrolase family 8 [Hallerella succinigenes]PJJ40936.1 glycosyl hydrolase family 8 [Hallerella succinigenes]